MSDNQDGGYFAIKGFLYQFDKTLIEVLNNPTVSAGMEEEMARCGFRADCKKMGRLENI